MRSLSIIALILAVSGPAGGSTIYVPDDYPGIQLAIDHALNGDVIIVRRCVYKENIDYKGKAVLLRSEEGPRITVIDGNGAGSVVTFAGGEGPGSVLEGFTITNGAGTYVPNDDKKYGGGIYCRYATPVIRDNIIRKNWTAYLGWGTARGGGIACVLYGLLAPVISCNLIEENWVGGYGAGIYCLGGAAVITNNLIIANTAEDWSRSGGGRPPHSDVRGGGIYLSSAGTLVINNTIHGNLLKGWEGHGPGIYAWGEDSRIVNSIVWENSGGWMGEIEGTTPVAFCDVHGGHPGMGNINEEPKFVDKANRDFHLLYTSPCRHAGTNMAPGLPDQDFEGDPRVAHGWVDIGADEIHRHLYFTGETAPGGSAAIKIVDLPGTAPVILGVSNGLIDPPMKTMYGLWHLKLPLVLQIGLGAVPGEGIVLLPFTFPPDFPVPMSIPLQALCGSQVTNHCVMHVE